MKPEFFYRISLVGKYIGMDLPMTFDTGDEALEFATGIFGEEKRMTVIEYRNGIPNRVYFSHNDILDEVGEGWVETKEYVGEVMTA
ncbi:hypothetical protein J6S46_00090 [Candidatus Saccharibacteria bacterium]|nr:hypothetical protein [Candidatus Saccharibacteria bacterium]